MNPSPLPQAIALFHSGDAPALFVPSGFTLGLSVGKYRLAILTFPVKISSLVSTEYEASVDYASLALLRQDSR